MEEKGTVEGTETVEKTILDFKNYLNAYEFETELPGSGEVVRFKPMTTGQLKQLLIYENENDPMVIEEALDKLISSSVVSEGFNIDRMYLQDRFYLLVEIRKKSKGEKYTFQYNCSECKSQKIESISLSSLNVEKMPEKIDKNIDVSDKLSVQVSHITRGKQKEAYRSVKDKSISETRRITEMALFTHAASIDSIIVPEGEITDASLKDRKFLLENIPTNAYERIRDWFDENDFGLEFKYDIRCGCGHSEKIDIPTDNFFF